MKRDITAGLLARLFSFLAFAARRARQFIAISACAALCSCDQSTAVSKPETVSNPVPNILLVVVDDMGYSDIGAFGGEIPTPTIDALAMAGIRFSDFQVLPACSPTRATMLTGREPHAVGFGSLAEEIADNQRVSPAYSGALPAGIATLPRLLRTAGYQTLMAGKWHLGFEQGRGPTYFGFDRSVAMLDGGASHFADMKPAYSPDPDAVARYTIDDQLIQQLPDSFEYSSQFWADQLSSMLEAVDANSPVFAYLSFTAPHWPLQAPDEAIQAFEGRYTEGYEVLHAQRLASLKALGLVDDTAQPGPLPPKVKPWSALSDEQKKREARAMAVYAAMIAEIDSALARVMRALEHTGRADNTLVVFLSDNGAEGHDLDETWPADLFPAIRAVIDERFDHSTEQMGRPNSYTLYGAGWAHASAPHLRLYKGFPTEGGTRVSAFISGALLRGSADIAHQTVSVRDIMPTLLAVAGVEVDPELSRAMTGRNLLPWLSAETDALPETTLAIEFLGKRSVRDGKWKLVELPAPYGDGSFALYDLSTDPGETTDLSTEHPQIFDRLKRRYQDYAEQYQVIAPDWVSGY